MGSSIGGMTVRRPLLPWLVYGAGVLAYAVAIINRSSLSALGPTAQEHFSIDATTLAAFAVIQLLVYAGMQIPVGVLLDRFGSTVLIISGGVLMAGGQLVMAAVSDVTLVILARVLVGVGDACTFISVMRLLPEWFSVRQLPTVSQWTGFIGQVGQLVSVTPLALAVGAFGWFAGFSGIVAVCLLVAILGALVLRDKPGDGTAVERMSGRLGPVSQRARSLGASDSTTALMAVAPPATSAFTAVKPGPPKKLGLFRKIFVLLSIPGVRLAFWVHFTSPFATTVFVLLWGTPFLQGGVGLSESRSNSLLNLAIVAGMLAALALGPLTSRFVERRVWINWGITLSIMLVWVVVLLWPNMPPFWLLVVLMVVISVGGPASMISFEVARSHTPRSLSGVGIGLVNTAGFIAALLVIFFIGFVLDLQGAGSPELYTLDAFRWAFAVQVPVWLLGLIMMVVEERKTIRWMRDHGHTLR